MRFAWLRLADDRILIEQLRLIYANMTITVVPTFPAIFLLVWTLGQPGNWGSLLAWTAVVSATNAYSIFDARRQLARGLVAGDARRLLRRLVLSIFVAGLSWGALAFGALGNTTAVGSILVISVLAGVSGGSVGLFAPVFAVYVAFIAPLVGLTVARLFQLDDPAYAAFGFIALFYIGTLITQSYMAGRAVLAAINLRFENLELLAKTEAAQKNAEQANAAKSKFLAAASHDLRQPIHAQGLFLEVLSHTPLSPHQAEVLASARLASEASGDMLNTLLDFSRVEAGVVEPFAAPFKLQTLLYKIENDLAPVANAKGLVYRSRETSAVIHSDASLVEMVLRNLVSNAIRYTEQGGVLVACRLHHGMAVVEVWDTGIGIATENQLEIFREFHQLGNPERDRRKGLGLGLAIADGLAKTMGHALTLSSVPGRGSVFRLALPLSVRPVQLAPASAAAHASLAEVRVLVIDDDDAVLAAMAHLLRSWGCAVTTADSIEQAMAQARKSRPDVVLSDYRLRGQQTGLEAITGLRGLLGDQLPAMMITGDTAPDRLRETLGSGVPLLHKPVAPEQLYQALAGLLAGRQAVGA
ncbi:MAG: ATP-binding protein [Polaromonas sp.]|uniref:ATP-binding response regulator n=1 Tax=Polaromonas sp. TaxID=1869339 RepID=UPI0027336CD7|nr:ATP-binding protein [Polaromonas sp.]MDP2820424.1 ATP-binding protein [Polaromonas sp.]